MSLRPEVWHTALGFFLSFIFFSTAGSDFGVHLLEHPFLGKLETVGKVVSNSYSQIVCKLHK